MHFDLPDFQEKINNTTLIYLCSKTSHYYYFYPMQLNYKSEKGILGLSTALWWKDFFLKLNNNRASHIQQKAGQLKSNYLCDCNSLKDWGYGASCGVQEGVSTGWLAFGANGHWSLWPPLPSMVSLGPGSPKGSQAPALPSSQCAPAALYRRCHGVSALPLGSPAPWPSWKRTKPMLTRNSGAGLGLQGETHDDFCSQRH